MHIFRFTTTIRCGGCIEKVKPFLDGEISILSWSVDTSDPSRMLTVETTSGEPSFIIGLLEKAGYQATLLAV